MSHDARTPTLNFLEAGFDWSEDRGLTSRTSDLARLDLNIEGMKSYLTTLGAGEAVAMVLRDDCGGTFEFAFDDDVEGWLIDMNEEGDDLKAFRLVVQIGYQTYVSAQFSVPSA